MKNKKFGKHNNYKTYIDKQEVVRNLLSDVCLRNRRITDLANKEISGLFSRHIQSLPTTGDRTKSIAIDRDKRLRRKRGSKTRTWIRCCSSRRKDPYAFRHCVCEKKVGTIASVTVNPKTFSSTYIGD